MLKSSDSPIIISHQFDVAIDEVWAAITLVDKMRQWYFDNIPTFQAQVGFETEFVVTSEDRTFTHQWKVTSVILNKSVTYEWKYKEYAGCAFVTFELATQSNQTLLTLTNRVTEDFPSRIPEFQRSSCQAGWEYFIQGRLVDYLNR